MNFISINFPNESRGKLYILFIIRPMSITITLQDSLSRITIMGRIVLLEQDPDLNWLSLIFFPDQIYLLCNKINRQTQRARVTAAYVILPRLLLIKKYLITFFSVITVILFLEEVGIYRKYKLCRICQRKVVYIFSGSNIGLSGVNIFNRCK